MGIRSKYLSTKRNSKTHTSMHIHYCYSMPDKSRNNNYNNNTTCYSKFEWNFLYPVKT